MSEHYQAHAVHRDDYGAKIGMWLFLFTEVLLFGGLFLLYMTYRFQYTQQFVFAASELNLGFGTANTIILLTSSLTMVISIIAIQKNNKLLSVIYLLITIGLALFFMVNKFFEWSAKFAHGIYPGSPDLANKENGEIMFFGLYYMMTGLHGFHVIVGVIIMCFMLKWVWEDKITADNYIRLENAGLYWHLVDLIWIFLFPLFYLMH